MYNLNFVFIPTVTVYIVYTSYRFLYTLQIVPNVYCLILKLCATCFRSVCSFLLHVPIM